MRNLICLMVMCRLLVAATALHADEPKPTLQAQPGLPFSDNAVLQQQIPLPVWGTTLPGASVTVSFDGQTHGTTADAQGHWRIVLEPLTATKLTSVNKAPRGKKMVITCKADGKKAVKRIDNLLIGEVWLCAGQSNMAGKMRTNKTRHHPADSIERANYPALRHMVSPGGGWLVCSPETAPEFKKVCFFFGRRVQADVMVPIGLINAAVGGSSIESWLTDPAFGASRGFGKNYDTHIRPLIGFGMRGVVWYQGESNASDGRDYLPKLRSLIRGLRTAWRQADSKSPDGPRRVFSFYFVQLPGIGTSSREEPAMGDGRAEIREAQFEALALPRTGMAVTLDIGDVREHPPNKYDTGVRLAHLALHGDYGKKDTPPTGPLYKGHAIDGDTIRITFDHVGSGPDAGLMVATKQGFDPPRPVVAATLGWLSVRDSSGKWHWATGEIDGHDLLVRAAGVNQPVAARYAYTNHPTGPLLYNRAGLPAGPFTTCGYDQHPQSDQ